MDNEPWADPHNNNWRSFKPNKEMADEWQKDADNEERKFFKRHKISDADLIYYNSVKIDDRMHDNRWIAISQRVRKCRQKDIAPDVNARAPYGIMDGLGKGIDGFKCMADGKTYDSKSKYLAALKAADSHVVEAGEHKPDAQHKLRGDFGCRKELQQAVRQHLHR